MPQPKQYATAAARAKAWRDRQRKELKRLRRAVKKSNSK
jgi:hypothetical protein